MPIVPKDPWVQMPAWKEREAKNDHLRVELTEAITSPAVSKELNAAHIPHFG